MRILAVSDLHYALRQFDWVGAQLENFDLLVMAGDLLDLGSAVDLDVQEVVVEKYLRRFASHRTLLSSSGNHDISDTRPNGERAALWMESLQSSTLKPDYDFLASENIVITVCPWWDGPDTRAKTEARLLADAAKPKDTWIWLHHNPPLGTPVAWTGKEDGGDPVALEWIHKYQPDFVFSGHIHNAPFYADGSWHCRIGKSLIFNPGKQPGGEPTRIVLDLKSRRADWISIECSESLEV
jgi:Icc-related predicted phosphoesterase